MRFYGDSFNNGIIGIMKSANLIQIRASLQIIANITRSMFKLIASVWR